MKKEELRIGNWYMSVKFAVPVRCELSDLHELCVKSDGAYGDPPIGEMFEAIPLNEEWFLKLGYEIQKQLPFYKMVARYKNMTITSNEDNVYIFWVNSFRVQIKYVHQLQTIYFDLTGEELKADKL